MADIDFRGSSYILYLQRAGLFVRLLEGSQSNQRVYCYPLFEYKLDVATKDAVGDFDPRNASIEEVEAALKSPSARVRMRAIITLSAKGNVGANTILLVASLRADNGEYDYEFGKVYGPASRFCPTVSVCAQLYLRVLACMSPAATLELLTGVVRSYSEQERERVTGVLGSIGLDAIAAALATKEPVQSVALCDARQFLAGRLPDVSTLIAAFVEGGPQRESNVVAYLASKSRWALNDFIRTILERDSDLHSWICEGLLHQREKALCDQLAERVGGDSVPYLIRGLASPDEQVRKSCAYAISRQARMSHDARSALDAAVRSESGFLTRWAMRGYLKKMGS